MGDEASWRIYDGIAVLTIDNPPVNAISAGVRASLVAGVARAVGDPALTALVIICAGRTFLPGPTSGSSAIRRCRRC